MSEIYESTMALSVYNVLSLAGRDLPVGKIEQFLRDNFDQNLSEDYVARGVGYLTRNEMAADVDGMIVIPRLPNKRGKPLVRSRDDRELLKASY